MSISKQVLKKATGALRDKFVDYFYDPLIKGSSEYGLDSDNKILSFLAQIGHESGGLFYVEELANGEAYEGRKDLGNTKKGDGKRYKGRGVIQLTGRANYRRSGSYLNENFEGNPQKVSPKNSEHKTGGGTKDQYENAVKSALWFWRKGSAWGDLNDFAKEIDLDKGLFIGSFDPSRLPDKNSEAKRRFNVRPRKGGASQPKDYTGRFIVDSLGLDREKEGKNLFMFELISVGINGGYNGFRDRFEKFEEGRKALLGDNYQEPLDEDFEGSVSGDDLNLDEFFEDDNIEDDNIEDTNFEEAIENSENITGITNIFPPSISIDTIEIKNGPDKSFYDEVGRTPLIYFNDVQIDQVDNFVLSSFGFLPTVRFDFVDTYSYFDNLRFPDDDARLKVFLRGDDPILRPIFCEFKILKFIKIGQKEYSVEGMLNVNFLYVTKIQSFSNLSSYDVFKEVARLSKLGFSSNISQTDDNMTWINPGNRVIDFLKEDVLNRSYRSDSSFMWGFVDFYYNLNLIDIQEQYDFDISEQKGITTATFNKIIEDLGGSKQIGTTPLFLTNDRSASKSPLFFEEYKLFNSSTFRSIQKGYSNQITYYSHNEKSFLIFDIDSINDENKLILKSEDDDFLKENISFNWMGKLIEENAHENYLYSKIHNDFNLSEMQKIGLEVVMPNLNYNLYKFMKINVNFTNQGIPMVNPTFNKKLSGEYIIIDIKITLQDGVMKQKLMLVRRDLGFSPEQQKN